MSKSAPIPDGADAGPTRHGGPRPKDDAEAPPPTPASPYPFLLPPVEPGELGRIGHYRVLRLIGAGGMGMVFAAEDIALRRPVAIKAMRPELASDPTAGWQRFLREARALASVKHPNLVTVYQVFQDRGSVFLVMELLEGESLDSRLHRPDSASLDEILQIGIETAAGLAALHAHNLIHRDIKPANIWLEAIPVAGTAAAKSTPAKATEATSDVSFDVNPAIMRTAFQVKILDLGLVRGRDDHTLTETGMVVGTPAYMSLEQVRGQELDHRTDLFSLGCVLYALCTGQPPFAAEDPVAQATALVKGTPQPACEANPDIPKTLSDLIAQLLAKKPEERPETAQLVIERLQAIRREPTPPVPKAAAVPVAPKPKPAPTVFPVSEPEPLPKGERKSAPSRAVTKDERRATTREDEAAPVEKSGRGKKAKGKRKKSFLRDNAVTLVAVVWLLVACMLVIAVVGKRDKPEAKAPDGGKQPDTTNPTPTPKAGEPIYLTDLRKHSTTNWPFPPGKDPPPHYANPPTIGGKSSARSFFMHPAPPFEVPASITYKLDKQYKRFLADVTLNDTAASPLRCVLTFRVLGDSTQLWASKPITSQAGREPCNIDIVGVELLTLQVVADGDIRGADAVWLDPRVTK